MFRNVMDVICDLLTYPRQVTSVLLICIRYRVKLMYLLRKCEILYIFYIDNSFDFHSALFIYHSTGHIKLASLI